MQRLASDAIAPRQLYLIYETDILQTISLLPFPSSCPPSSINVNLSTNINRAGRGRWATVSHCMEGTEYWKSAPYQKSPELHDLQTLEHYLKRFSWCEFVFCLCSKENSLQLAVASKTVKILGNMSNILKHSFSVYFVFRCKLQAEKFLIDSEYVCR